MSDTKSPLTNDSTQIKGLGLMVNFMTIIEEQNLMVMIDKCPWNTALLRRTQHYGFEYNYAGKSASVLAQPIPFWCEFLVDRLMAQGCWDTRPNQLIINEYVPGQGIAPHVDNVNLFEDGIASVSLGSTVAMDFVKNDDPTMKTVVPLHRRSVIFMRGEARYNWKHGIAPRKTDFGIKRHRRISLTFRVMKTEGSKKQKVDE